MFEKASPKLLHLQFSQFSQAHTWIKRSQNPANKTNKQGERVSREENAFNLNENYLEQEDEERSKN